MHAFSFGELALIFGIILILFGGSRLASVGRSLGEGIANFKRGLSTTSDEATGPQAKPQPVPPVLLQETREAKTVAVDAENTHKSSVT